MGSSQVVKQKNICEDYLEQLDDKINYCLKNYKYDHYALFLIHQEIKFLIEKLNKSRFTNKKELDKFNMLKSNFESITKLYEGIRGDEM